MKPIILTIFLLSILFLDVKAQEEVSQLKPCPIPPKLTKEELKKNRKLPRGEFFDVYENIKIFVGIENKTLPNGKNISIVKAETNSYELTFTNTAENQLLVTKLDFFIRITSVDKKNDGCFEEKIRYSFKEDEVKKKIPILYQKVFELSKGIYTILFLVRDIETGKIGTQKIKFEIK